MANEIYRSQTLRTLISGSKKEETKATNYSITGSRVDHRTTNVGSSWTKIVPVDFLTCGYAYVQSNTASLIHVGCPSSQSIFTVLSAGHAISWEPSGSTTEIYVRGTAPSSSITWLIVEK